MPTEDPTAWSGIQHGLIIGGGAGVVTSIILGIYYECKRAWIRRQEITALREFLLEAFERIGRFAFAPPPPGEDQPPVDLARYALVREFADHLDAALAHRTTALRPDQLFALRARLTDLTRILTMLENATTGAPAYPVSMWRSYYEGFLNLRWLKMPETPPWET